MKTAEERILAMHGRAKELYEKKNANRLLAVQIVSVAVCLAAAVGLALFIPSVAVNNVPSDISPAMNASIFSDNSALAYIVISVVAFLLGAAVTVFCFSLKKWQKRKDQHHLS